MQKKVGKQTVKLSEPVSIISTASTVGPKEGEGPLAQFFDNILEDELWEEKSWEKAETKIVKETFLMALNKAKLSTQDIDYIICGDLLNQNTGSTFAVRDLDIPFFGIFGACSTMGEGMSLGSLLIDGGFAEKILIGASSHFCATEKQYRFPLELGTQRAPTSSWTVTGQGSAVLSKFDSKYPSITAVTTGKIVDMGINDVNNMGAAMAPAAAQTLMAHFEDLAITPDYYDLIFTGDLGHIGHELVYKLCAEQNIKLMNYQDCGMLIFDKERQDTNAGGSGCACAAVTFAGYIYSKLMARELNKVLFIPTGALMSATSTQQGETIPGIAHAVAIEMR